MKRFAALADAYGGAIARWPADSRDDAFGLMVAAPEETARVLAGALALDAALDEAPRLAPSHALRQTVLAAAPRAGAGLGAIRRWLVGAGLGVGLAAATAAGLLVGVSLSPAGPGEDAQLLANAYSTGLLDETGGVS
ncbi:MAG: hypothetical protein Q8L66_15490 [Caulobacter sp.]|nr:hypothetical protein [Caulobacter sp.]